MVTWRRAVSRSTRCTRSATSGMPDDIAWGCVYLASDEAKFVTGAELVIDGGYTAR